MPRLPRCALLVMALLGAGLPARGEIPEGSRRVVFLGDSITYAGGSVEYAEAFLRTGEPPWDGEFLNLGLPSETVSGLSEPGHAGGAFPRPALSERLGRVLDQTKPDLVVACYGMNDGIYYPFDEERFRRFRDGMAALHEQVTARGARVLHLTPPVFDPLPIRDRTLPAGRAEYPLPFEGYDDVLGRESDWLLTQHAQGWDVADTHGPMKEFLRVHRERDANYRLADDGVHVNALGQWLIARELLRHWGVPAADLGAPDETGEQVLGRRPRGLEVLALVRQRQRLMKDAWLTATGHQRPGMNRGLPLPEAQAEARAIAARLRALRP